MTAPGDHPGVPPFFIVGCGRSGTSLLRTMLDHHPAVCIPPEALCLIDLLRARRAPIDRLRRTMLADHEIRAWGVPLDPGRYDDCTSAAALIERVHELRAEQRAKPNWGHKTPRFVRHTGLLREHFPAARFVHVVRDPRAVALSFMRSPLHRSNPLYAARRWRRDAGAGRQLTDTHPERAIETRYEDLVAEPRETLARVCAFLGLDFDERTLAYHRDAADELRPSHRAIHARLAAPPDPARIHAWRDTLTPGQIRTIETIAGPLMDRFGYQRLDPEPTPRTLPAFEAARYKAQRLAGLAGQTLYALRRRGGFLPNFVARKLRLGLHRDLLDLNA